MRERRLEAASMQFGAKTVEEWHAQLKRTLPAPAATPELHHPFGNGDVGDTLSKPLSVDKRNGIPNGCGDAHLPTSPSVLVNKQPFADKSRASGASTLEVASSPKKLPDDLQSSVPSSPLPPAVTLPGSSAPPKRSWAQLVKNSGPASSTRPTSSPTAVAPKSPPPAPPVTPQVNTPPPPLAPRRIRGLINSGNTCFANVMLQSLMACDELRRFLLNRRDMENPQLVQHFVDLATDMSVAADAKVETLRDKSHLPNADDPILHAWAPDFFFNVKGGTNGLSGTQEDSEEFLTSMLNHLHEALVEGDGGNTQPPVALKEDHGWREISRGGKQVSVADSGGEQERHSAVTRIFAGVNRYELKRPGEIAHVQRNRFFHLQLDIESDAVRNLNDAVVRYFSFEQLENTDLRQHVSIDTLPKVLILHVKRTSFQSGGVTEKVCRRCDFNEKLTIAQNLCAFTASLDMRTYKLVAAVTHMGRDTNAGHYVADIRVKQVNGNDIWVHCDDSKVTRTTLPQVLRRQAYVLFFARDV